jgi:hypothetical protein
LLKGSIPSLSATEKLVIFARLKAISLTTLLSVATLLLSTPLSLAAPAPAPTTKGGKIRTFLDCPGLPRESLKNGVSAKFYKSLQISPLDGWIVVRAPLHGMKSANARVIRSDAGGAFDSIALGMANSMQVTGLNTTESRINLSEIEIHLLIYKIADGIMCVGFSHIDDPKYAGYRQYGRATIGFLKNGQWTFMDNKLQRR